MYFKSLVQPTAAADLEHILTFLFSDPFYISIKIDMSKTYCPMLAAW